MEGAAFGLADGIICCLGLIIGVAEATINFPALERRSIILASGILGGLANAFGNSIGFSFRKRPKEAFNFMKKEWV